MSEFIEVITGANMKCLSVGVTSMFKILLYSHFYSKSGNYLTLLVKRKRLLLRWTTVDVYATVLPVQTNISLKQAEVHIGCACINRYLFDYQT